MKTQDKGTRSAGETSSLAALIEGLSAGLDRLDERFVRQLSAALHAQANRVELPLLEAMGVRDVLATFSMDRRVTLVATASLREGPGELTLRWREEDFDHVPVRLLHRARAEPYTFATLDYQRRGEEAELLRAAGGLPAGTTVRLRALATVGEERSWRVQAHGIQASVPEDALALRRDDGDSEPVAGDQKGSI